MSLHSIHGHRLFLSLITFLITSPAAMATTASITHSPISVNSSISFMSYFLIVKLIVAGSLLILCLNLLALGIWWAYVMPKLKGKGRP